LKQKLSQIKIRHEGLKVDTSQGDGSSKEILVMFFSYLENNDHCETFDDAKTILSMAVEAMPSDKERITSIVGTYYLIVLNCKKVRSRN